MVIAGGMLMIVNVHGLGSGGDSWASKATVTGYRSHVCSGKKRRRHAAGIDGGDFSV